MRLVVNFANDLDISDMSRIIKEVEQKYKSDIDDIGWEIDASKIMELEREYQKLKGN